jgi:hypothetical protein
MLKFFKLFSCFGLEIKNLDLFKNSKIIKLKIILKRLKG